MTKSYFISFEGGEGCGKTTQSKLLALSLLQAGEEALLTREPGGTKAAEAIRALLMNVETGALDGRTDLLLHTAARNEHVVHAIKPALAKGVHVICDRFLDSTLVYQGYGNQLGPEIVEKLHKLIIGDFYPDLTIILDIEAEQGLERAKERGNAVDRYEAMGLNFHKIICDNFRALVKNGQNRYAMIDANQDVSVIHKKIIEIVRSRLDLTELKECAL